MTFWKRPLKCSFYGLGTWTWVMWLESKSNEQVSYAVWTAPGTLGCLLHVGVQTDHVVGSGTGVAQDDLATLLANLTVVLVVCLISVTILCFWSKGTKTFTKKNLSRPTKGGWVTYCNPGTYDAVLCLCCLLQETHAMSHPFLLSTDYLNNRLQWKGFASKIQTSI